uniref:Protein translocase subunit SecA n=1 Tax=Gelidium vagum TaxID=35171 RepID=A0A141SE35_GELVA|nr:preprotein translocase subunit SecA [Gelidium vagum]AMK96553.1 preprotein translocase subunit SecA [Gelidium vagum]
MFNFLFNNKTKKIESIIAKIKRYEEKTSQLSNKELKQQTQLFIELIKQQTTLDEILPRAYACTKEAIKRALNLTLFDVQLIGATVLHRGQIAEMQTGEGKTLVAIVAAYLNSITKQGVHIVTVNEYLAERDFLLASQILSYLDTSIGLVKQFMNNKERYIAYNCDITYITNSELGFDYLRDNMSIHKKDLVQRTFNFAIIDEVDSILIDEARTPLIISGPAEVSIDKYSTASKLANTLAINLHYEIDEKAKSINLTEEGIIKCEQYLNIENLYDINNVWVPYILNALKAKELFICNRNYIIKNQEVVIVDEFTGRIMEGRRWSDGLHQAIESKENVTIQQENRTLASITYQNLFLLYNKLSGMTGTAKTEEIELDKIYSLEVINIPTNCKNQRKDLPDLVYKSEYSKWQAIANECFDMYKIGKPTLIGTTNVEKSEFLATMLSELNVKYNLLNAKPKNIARESEIIAQAGRKNSITIATNMAGRGTDIMLGGNPYIMSKIVLIDYIKNKIKQKEVSSNYIKDINLYMQEINNENIKRLKQISKLDSYIEKLVNNQFTRSINNSLETDILSMHYNLLEKYKTVFTKEKLEVLNLGGLYVIGTERHESRRIDNQLRGRSGRQGDIGSSRFFLSLEDNLLRIFGGDKISQLMQKLNIDEDIPIESAILSSSLDSAQKKVESYFYDVRKQLFEYDEVINNQRQAIYNERKRILESTFTRDCILEYGESTIDAILNTYKNDNNLALKENRIKQISQLLNFKISSSKTNILKMDMSEIRLFFYEQLHITYNLKESYLEQLRPGLIRQLEKYYLLQQIDQAWQEHLDKMNLLRESIGWRSYGQQDPLIEYKNEAFNLFINMVTYIRQTVIYLILRSRLIINID